MEHLESSGANISMAELIVCKLCEEKKRQIYVDRERGR